MSLFRKKKEEKEMECLLRLMGPESITLKTSM